MKTRILALLVLATGFLAAGTFAQTAPPGPTPAAAAPTPEQIIHVAQLPSVADLTNAAAAQGLTIKQIIQTAGALTVSYQLADGQAKTVAYQLLPAVGSVAVPPSASVVVYAPPPTVVYYDGPYYYPGYWYPPFSVRLGFGFHGRWR